MKLVTPLFLCLLFVSSCGEKPAEPESEVKTKPAPAMKKMTKKFTGSYTGEVLLKTGTNKAGKPLSMPDYYFRLSMGDYFIKVCESVIDDKTLAEKVGKFITVKGTIKKGEWDTCPGDPEGIQSRIGDYFVITELIN